MFYYRAYRYLWMIAITCMFEAQAHSDFFPEYCRNMYFHENYKDLIANPDEVKNGKVTINSTIINEANNSGTCYANAGTNIFEGQMCSPHPIVSALTYKTTLASNKDTLEGGYLDIFLNKINNLIEICDSKKLHDFYGAKFYVDLFLDKLS